MLFSHAHRWLCSVSFLPSSSVVSCCFCLCLLLLLLFPSFLGPSLLSHNFSLLFSRSSPHLVLISAFYTSVTLKWPIKVFSPKLDVDKKAAFFARDALIVIKNSQQLLFELWTKNTEWLNAACEPKHLNIKGISVMFVDDVCAIILLNLSRWCWDIIIRNSPSSSCTIIFFHISGYYG